MIANLMHVAGVNHVITIDLHASQMQGFFKCPVDNLIAEPILAKWIRKEIQDWRNAVIVSKNPGGTKRVTSLADSLKLSFGIVTTDRRRMHMPGSMYNSVVFEAAAGRSEASVDEARGSKSDDEAEPHLDLGEPAAPIEHDFSPQSDNYKPSEYVDHAPDGFPRRPGKFRASTAVMPMGVNRLLNGAATTPKSPLAQSIQPPDSPDTSSPRSSLDGDINLGSPAKLQRMHTAVATTNPSSDNTEEDEEDAFTDEVSYSTPHTRRDTDPGLQRARNVITGRLIHGHLVDDDYPSPMLSAMSSSIPTLRKEQDEPQAGSPPDHMVASFMSNNSSHQHGLGGTGDATASDEEEEEALKDPELETTITLVGNVRGKPVVIVDDIIDKAGSWIAAAEHVVKRGGATKVYCMATHGLFGAESLREMEACKEIDRIIVTNSFPLPEEKTQGLTKLVVLDVSHLLSEAIRRNAHGESISQLFQHYVD